MSHLDRPSKQGGATTYQGKVAAGYTKILASEMDADLDLIYSAWNTGVDTVNISDGSITGAKLAPGAVGSRELADGGVQTVDLADGAVTPVKMAGGGAMGGDLTGTFPNPSLGVIQSGQITLGHGGRVAAIAGLTELSINEAGVPGADATQPSWLLRLDASGDGFLVLRAPPGSGSYTNVAAIDSTGKLYATLVGGSVGRTQLGVNAIYGASTTSPCPAPFSLSTPVGQWVNYMTLSPITTRGGLVMLKAQYNLAGIGAVSGAQTIAVRWLRSGSPLTERAWLIATATATALPALELMDNPPAGTYTYSMQLWISASCLIVGTASAQGFLQAIEIG